MKQKRLKNKKRANTINMTNKQTATSAAYKPIKSDTKDYQKSNYDNQTDNKENNGNIDMSMGLGKENNKSKTKTMDQRKDKSSLPKEAATTTATTATTSSPLPPAQSDVFDSSRDNAMPEMKEVADMRPDETSKIFSHVEEKQQLDPSNISINDDIKITVSENNPNTISDHTSVSTMVDSALRERDPSTRELIEEDIMPTQDVKLDDIKLDDIKLDDITQVNKESEKQGQLDESARFYGNWNEESYSNLPNTDNNNPFIIGIKLWQAHNIAWMNAYNEFMKAWIDNIKTDS